MHPTANAAAELPDTARLRSGTAARLAGVPVSTLRVWERRYGVVAAPKTPTGQRLYTPHDVQRLGLIKRMTDAGHAIGTIATLPLLALQQLEAGSVPPPARAGGRRRLCVVGRSAARRLAAAGWEAQVLHDDLDRAEAHAEPGAADLLVVHLPSLQPADAARVQALAARLQAATTVVLYAFGAEPVAESLRAAGITVRRDPVSGRELARLLLAAAPQGTAPAPWQAAPRRYSDDALSLLAEAPSSVLCECPRHLAEIVMQLAAFERYSADCGSRSPADAALHRQLHELAGAARAQFEQALAQVARSEGLELP